MDLKPSFAQGTRNKCCKNSIWVDFLLILPVILIGIYFRFVSINETEVKEPIRSDAREYFMYAYNLRHKHTYSRQVGDPENLKSAVYPDAVRAPGYPLFLTPFVDGLPTKRMLHGIQVAQVILSTLTILFSFLMFKAYLSPVCAWIASLLIAISPHLIVANSYLLTETLFCFMIVSMGVSSDLFIRNTSPGRAAVLGLSMGFAFLIRPSLQYFPFFFVFLLLIQLGTKRGVRPAVCLVLGFLIVCAPWILRNLTVLKKTSDPLLTINFLHHGMYPNFTYGEVRESYGFPYRFDPRSKEISQSVGSVLKEISKRFRNKPGRHLKWYLLEKPFAFWSWNIVQGMGDVFVYPVSKSPYFTDHYFQWTHWIMYKLHWSLVLLSFIGSLIVWGPMESVGFDKRPIFMARFCSIMLIYYTAIHMIGAPFPRYSIPLRPFMFGMAFFTINFLTLFVRSRRLESTISTPDRKSGSL